MSKTSKIKVLVAEDSTVVRMVLVHLLESDPGIEVVGQVGDGQAAVDFVQATPPDAVLMDIHMPRMNGYEVMEAINRDESLRSLTVVVLTTSSDEMDVERMYKMRCNSYLTKPVEFNEFAAVVGKLSNYWFELVVLPGDP